MACECRERADHGELEGRSPTRGARDWSFQNRPAQDLQGQKPERVATEGRENSGATSHVLVPQHHAYAEDARGH